MGAALEADIEERCSASAGDLHSWSAPLEVQTKSLDKLLVFAPGRKLRPSTLASTALGALFNVAGAAKALWHTLHAVSIAPGQVAPTQWQTVPLQADIQVLKLEEYGGAVGRRGTGKVLDNAIPTQQSRAAWANALNLVRQETVVAATALKLAQSRELPAACHLMIQMHLE